MDIYCLTVLLESSELEDDPLGDDCDCDSVADGNYGFSAYGDNGLSEPLISKSWISPRILCRFMLYAAFGVFINSESKGFLLKSTKISISNC